ncbi:MAG: M28 family peptidase [Promethearchaeia archaeon]
MFIRKQLIIPFIGSGIIITAFLIIFNLNPVSQNIDVDLYFNDNNAYDYIEDQLSIGYRIPGTTEREKCALYFISSFKNISSDFSVIIHNFTIQGTNCQNLLFKLNEEKKNIVILGAHYDTRARATKDNDNPNDPVPGANDGASGCAVLLELARALFKRKDNLDCQLWFVFFDAEDQGYDVDYGIDNWDWIEGSTKFVEDIDSFYDKSEEKFDLMILLDMIGAPNLELINEQYSTSSLLDEIFEVGRQLGYNDAFPSLPISQSVVDDHKPFIEFGIPSADLIINFWNNPDWPYHHTTQDTIEHISQKSLKIIGETVEQFILNNYFTETNENYHGNYPYNEDYNIPPTDILIYISIIVGIIAITIVSLYYIKNKSDRDKLLNNSNYSFISISIENKIFFHSLKILN